jgi:hypothetical protein
MIFQHAYEPPHPLLDLAPDVPAPVVAIVARMMAKDPRDRYQSARRVGTAGGAGAGFRGSSWS